MADSENRLCARIYLGTDGKAYPQFCHHPGLSARVRKMGHVDSQTRVNNNLVIVTRDLAVIPSGIIKKSIKAEGEFDAWASCKSNGTGIGCNQYLLMDPAVLQYRLNALRVSSEVEEKT
jgi:hypothetical protein